jgi:NitT/TauT family transport system substrate-binding protein
MKKTAFTVLVFVSVVFSGCRKDEDVLRIAEQWGLAYLPLQIVKEHGLFAEYLPDTEVKWIKLNNAAAIRESMLAGKLDAGFMGIPPFLIGEHKGMTWEIFCGLSSAPLGLVVSDPAIRELSDFSAEHRIALPQPGSIQHILLSMACERELGRPDALDHLLVAMSHPDGMNALLAEGDITAHFTSPPYLFEELKMPGFHTVVTGREAFGGDFTFIVGVVSSEFAEEHAEVVLGITEAVDAAIRYIRRDPAGAAAAAARLYNLPEEHMAEYLSNPDMTFSTAVQGVEQFRDFMKGQNYW